MESNRQTQITLAPNRLSLRSDQTDVTVSTWGRVNTVTAQQVTIHQSPYILTCLDANSSEILGTYLYEQGSTEPKLLADPAEAPAAARRSTLFFHGWLLSVSEDHAPTYFRSLKDFTTHAQRVADSTGTAFKLTVKDQSPEDDALLTFTPETESQELEEETFQSRLAAAPVMTEEVEPKVVQATPIQADTSESEPEEPEEPVAPTVQNGTVEEGPSIEPDRPASVHSPAEAPDPEEPATAPEQTQEQAEEEHPQMIRYSTLEEMFSDQQETDEDEDNEKPAPRRKRLLLTTLGVLAACSVLGASAFAGISLYQASTEASTLPTATAVSQTVVDLPVGYTQQPAWTLPIPDGARVHSSQAATAIIDGKTITLYSNATGKEIRSVTGDEEIAVIDETAIDGKPGIVWLNADKTKLTAWIADESNAEGKIITADLPAGATVTRPSAEIIIKDSQAQVFRLTQEGLKQYQSPQGLSPWAFTDKGLVSLGYDVPSEVTDPAGQAVAAIDLVSPEAGYSMLQWVSIGNDYAASIWAQNLNSVTDQSQVKLVIHSLSSGQPVEVIDGPLQSLEPTIDSTERSWVIGQGNDLATYGPYIFSLRTGKLQTVLPNGTTGLPAKGTFGLASAPNGATYIFQGTEAGYTLSNKIILAQSGSTLITQAGNRVVAYPATLS